MNHNGISTSRPSEGLLYEPHEYRGTCKITGIGTCADTDIVIPETVGGYRVTEIACSAFENCQTITSVTIPDSVTYVGGRAFASCASLRRAVLPNAIKEIHYGLFSCCTSLAKVNIPDTVTEIWNSAFFDCEALTSAVIPDGVKWIGECAFEFCESLASVTLPDSLTAIDDHAFRDCTSLASLFIPDALEKLGEGALFGIGRTDVSESHPLFTSVDGDLYSKDRKTLIHCNSMKKTPLFQIPDSVTRIDLGAFGFCKGIERVEIPDSVTRIEDLAFCGCTGLTSVTLPDELTYIYLGVFRSCENLVRVKIGNSVIGIGRFAFCGCPKLREVEIPHGIRGIGEGAFEECESLTELTLPDSLRRIQAKAFAGCKNLRAIRYTGSKALWERVEKEAPTDPVLAQAISFLAPDPHIKEFQGFRYRIDPGGKTCTVVGADTADRVAVIPASIEGLPVTAVASDRYGERGERVSGFGADVTDAVIPDSVTQITESAFRGCKTLKTLRYEGTKKQCKQIQTDQDWSKDWKKYTSVRKIRCKNGTARFGRFEKFSEVRWG